MVFPIVRDVAGHECPVGSIHDLASIAEGDAAENQAADAGPLAVRDALRAKDYAGLGQITMRGREHLCAVTAYKSGLLLETLAYANEVRSSKPLFSAIADEPADEELLAVASQLMERCTRS